MNRWETWRPGIPYLMLAAILMLAAATYRNVLTHGMVLDDSHTIQYNPALRSLALAPQWVTSPYAVSGSRDFPNYRPMLVASYALDQAVWGPGARGYHATNLGIHLGVVTLGFVLARRLWGNPSAALCAAGLIALHPINAEAVNYLTARSSSLMAGFVLASIWAFARASTGADPRWLAAAYGFGLAALGTKEAAAVLPVLVLAWDRATVGGSWAGSIRRAIPWGILVGAFLAVRAWVLWGHGGTAITGPGVTLGQNLLFAVKIPLASMAHWFRPTGLAVDHAWPDLIGIREGVGLIAAGGAVMLATIIVARAHPRIGCCLCWFWAATAPSAALAFVSRMTLYQDHRVYLGGIGLAWLLGGVVSEGARRWMSFSVGTLRWSAAAARSVIVVGGGLLAASAVYADMSRTAVWSSGTALWDDVVAKYPRRALAYNVKGLDAMRAGDLEAARGWFERALRLSPGFSEAHKNIGLVFAQQRDWRRAVAALEFALRINPRYAEARVGLGAVYEEMGRPDLAFEAYEQVLRETPSEPDALRRSAFLLEQKGDFPAAAARYHRWVSIEPDNQEARMLLGLASLRAEQWSAARDAFQAVVARHPTSFPGQFNLAMALDGLGLWDEAIARYQDAAHLAPNDPDPYFRMGVILSKREQWAPAAAMYGRAIERDPRHFSAHMNLGLVAERLGDAQSAVAHYRRFLATVPEEPHYDHLKQQARHALVALSGGRT